jgi:hypothetical protein
MSGYQQRSQFPQRVKTILDQKNLKLNAKPLNGAKNPPSLSLYVNAGNVRIDVYTNLESDKANGAIQAGMDYLNANMMLLRLQHYAQLDTPPGESECMQNLGTVWSAGRPSENPVIKSKTVYGKTPEGLVYISVLSYDDARPKVRFYFGEGFFHHLVKPNGVKFEDAELSCFAAQAWTTSILQLLPHAAMPQYEIQMARDLDAKIKRDEKENRNGGGNGGGYGGGGGNKSAAVQGTSNDFDDDIPF